MARTKYFKWTPAKLRELVRLREVEKLPFLMIAAELGAPESTCQVYYNKIKNGESPKASKKETKLLLALKQQPAIARVEMHEPRPRAPVHPADAELSARIRAYGLTAGFFNDPPPGRSALDQRRGNVVAA